jgi:hypothetical protein
VSFYTRQADEMRRRGKARARHAAFVAFRLDRRAVMRRAWAVAREGARRFGGAVVAFFAEALRQSWAETNRHRAVLALGS